MFKLTVSAVALALAMSSALATVPEWGQCGGINYTGDTSCAAGTTCQVQNPYYSQCLPGAATVSSTAAPTPTSTQSSSSTTAPATTSKTASSTAPTSTAAPPSATGFVKASGTSFTLNGAPFTVAGENSYWVGLMGYSTTQMNQAFSDIAGTGATVVRTWGFNEVTSPSGDYYQSWSGSTPTVNTGPTGLENFDNVVAAAKANGIRLIVALTNNWSDYGGMDVYVKQILNSPNHDLFYTDATVLAAYKNYVSTFVGRYVNEPTIMGWELANEPRCTGSTGTSTGTCTTATITAWIKEMSAFIKSIDPNHLVAVGDEGFYNEPSAPTYPYQGSEGIDFNVNLAISSIDFGTFHSYPTSWGQGGNESAWGTQWIADHATSMKNANKPVIIEEFGVTDNQATIYTTWLNEVVSSGLTGELIWQAGSHFTTGDTPNDGYAVYPDGAVYPVLKTATTQLKARNN